MRLPSSLQSQGPARPIPWEDLPLELPSGDPVWVSCLLADAHPSNRLQIERIVDGRRLPPLAARIADSAAAPAGATRYLALLPPLEAGRTVEYTPVLTRSGLVVDRLPPQVIRSSAPPPFAAPAPEPPAEEPPAREGQPRFQWSGEFLGAFTVQLARPPESFGAAPDGLHVTFYIESGEIRGPRINARIRGEGGDWMLIRRDGVGECDVRITYETDDGALLLSCYYGIFDLGPDGYERALRQDYDPCPPLVLAPRFVTSHPRWLWLNRLQCIAVGRVTMATLQVRFDLYAVHAGHLLSASEPSPSAPNGSDSPPLPGQLFYPPSGLPPGGS